MYKAVDDTYPGNLKTSVKWLEIPIQKFNSAVPYFVDLLKDYHNKIAKLKRLNQWEDVHKQYSCASKTVKQLTSMVSEVDNLRNQVDDGDITKFDKLISNSKRSALSAIKSHEGISIEHHSDTNKLPYSNEDFENDIEDQLHVVADLTKNIQHQEQQSGSLERLQEDVKGLHELCTDFAKVIKEQGENVDKIESSVETAHNNVLEGESMLCKAVKHKSGMYPLVGALIGSILGGPIGLYAGFKLGGLMGFGCGLLGFAGGKILKNQNEVSIVEADHHREQLVEL